MDKRSAWIAGALVSVVALPLMLKLVRGEPAKQVDVAVVSTQALTPSILASGVLSYENQVTLAPEVTAQVKEILVTEGASVKRGQLLMRLDATAPRAEIQQYQALTRQARLAIETRQLERDALQTKWQRYEALQAKGMVDANTVAELRSQLDLAEVALRTSREALIQNTALLAAAQERLAKTEIRAPLDGKVTVIYVKVGETAVQGFSSIAGSQLMQVADTTHLQAEINVDETDIARVRVGAGVKVVAAAFPDRELKGAVVQVAMAPRQASPTNIAATSANRSYPVRIQLDNAAEASFRPGMSCRAEVAAVVGEQSKVIAVPVQAVKYEEELDNPDAKDRTGTSVFVVERDRVIKRKIKTGVADDTFMAVTQGLREGESIVTGPAKTLLFLRDQDRIVVSASSSSSSAASSVASAHD